MAIAFLGHKPNGLTLVVNHIDGDKLNNKLKNLEIVTHRENCSVCFRKNEDSLSSKYVGVSYYSHHGKWCSKIQVDGKNNILGYFDCEKEAGRAYQKALKNLVNF